MDDPPSSPPGVALFARTLDVLGGLSESHDGQLLTSPAGLPVVLSPHEVHRAAGLRARDDRRDFLAAHLLVRQAASRLLPPGAPPVRLLQRCATCGRDGHGRPTADGHPGLHLSLSHARGAVAAAAAWSPVGIDLEPRVSPGPPTSVLWEGTLTDAEQDLVRSTDPSSGFVRLWVRKEALVKVGAMTLERLTDADLSTLPLHHGTGPGTPRRWRAWTVTDWAEADHVGAVAAAGPVRIEMLPGGS